MSSWTTTRLGDVVELKRGYDLPQQSRTVGTVPIVSSSGVSGRHAEPMVKGPGVVTGRYGTLGEVFFVNEDFWPLNTTLYVRDFKGNDPRFISYFLRTLDFQAYSDKAAVPGVNRNHLHEAEVTVPPFDEQREIARILGALDDKIELNRRTSETLEGMARALFQSWFVDFDPVRAKADGESTESICARQRITPELLALFPDELDDSPLGPLPTGWRFAPLVELTTYLSRGISPKYLEEGGVLVLNQRCIRDGKVDVAKGRRHDVRVRSIAGRNLRGGDVLVNSTGVGTLGRVAQVMAVDEATVVDSHVTVVRADERIVASLYLGMALFERQADIEALAEGSTGQTELSRARLGALDILIPPAPLIAEFVSRVSPMRVASYANELQSAAIAAARDALLPRLLSGELRAVPLDV